MRAIQLPDVGCYRASVCAFVLLFAVDLHSAASAQSLGALGGPQPNLASNIERPLRYRPDGGDFVIENGTESFNRPLYGGNTAFRVDAGDRPEFVLYLPGRGGNLRFGLRTSSGAKWLHDAAQITTRYRPGEMHYEIRDPLLGPRGMLRLVVLALHQTEGLVAHAELVNEGIDSVRGSRRQEAEVEPTPSADSSLVTSAATGTAAVELLFAYGGVNGQRGRRDGDIGTEAVPISEWFQFRPEFCADNAITIDAAVPRFTLRSPAATIVGTAPAGTTLEVVEARRWHVGPDLWSAPLEASGEAWTRGRDAPLAGGPALQIVSGRVALGANEPLFLALQRVGETAATTGDLSTYRDITTATGSSTAPSSNDSLLPPFATDDLPRVFAETSEHFAALRRQIAVDTPDPFLNAAVAALNVAADAVWDEPQGVVMHGAIAWRTRLLGWRGPYAMDALGWHERARRHFRYWATRQNTEPIPEKFAPPEEQTNLARSRTALHTNGDLSQSHYDMNLVYIDAVFRHLLWTGDRELARELWPVIERHLAWERRLFRREFTTATGETLPLYEAYAAIWASDDLQYHGGGVTHASAYNYWHNAMAARVAAWLDIDARDYAREADAIQRGMRALLWLPEQGSFAEFRDLLGLQRAHPGAALWSVYHPLDAPALVNASEAWQLTRYVDMHLPRLPVRGPGVPGDEDHAVFATSNWLPYTWSINNVVMGENVHTALGFWRAGRADGAFRLTKSALFASMFMGICPGNIGSMNHLDVYRRESQRDFADGSGVLSRAIVEGLFGLQPDAIAGELLLAPGLPTAWERASIRTPEVTLEFSRDALASRYVVESRLPGVTRARLRVPALREDVRGVRVNGADVPAAVASDELGRPWLELAWTLAARNEVEIHWAGLPVMIAREEIDALVGRPSDRPLGESETHPTALAGGPPLSRGDLNSSLLEERGPRASVVRGVSEQLTPVDLTPHFNDRVTEIFRPGKYRAPRSPFVSLAIPAQGIGAWAGHVNATAEIDDSGLRALAGANGGRLTLPNGVPFTTPGPGDAPNVLFVSLWDNHPDEATIPLSGRARCVWLLMAGSTNHMQSRFDNGEIVVRYADDSTARLALHNPTNWWPIDQDYFIDDFQFRRPEPIPPRVNLKTGEVRLLDAESFKGRGRVVPGGAATVLALPLDATKNLESLTVRALANEVVIGLMAVTLERVE